MSTSTALHARIPSLARRRARRRTDDRGAVLVEFALVAPILVLLLLGIFEFGLAWRAQINLETAAGLAARQSSNLGETRQADYEALQSLVGSIESAGSVDITKVVVFRATGASGQPSNPNCLTANPTPSGTGYVGHCNIYHPNQLAALGATSGVHFGATCTGGSGSAWDRWWCPTARKSQQSDPPDYVGVQVVAELPAFTGLFGDGFTLTDTAIYRLEPDPQ